MVSFHLGDVDSPGNTVAGKNCLQGELAQARYGTHSLHPRLFPAQQVFGTLILEGKTSGQKEDPRTACLSSRIPL